MCAQTEMRYWRFARLASPIGVLATIVCVLVLYFEFAVFPNSLSSTAGSTA
jgi:hypothetical protein